MGNSKSKTVLPVVGDPKQPDVWKNIQNIGYCEIVSNLQTGEIAESYTIPLDGRIKLQEEFEKYEYRRTQNQNLVKVYKVVKKKLEYLCSGIDFINVKTERILSRLSEFRLITLPQAVYALNAALVGYKRIYELIGPVKVDGNMIGITLHGQIKVWLNQNLAKNHAELQFEFDPQTPNEQCQKQMIHMIIQTIQTKMQGSQFPAEIARRFTSQRVKTFQSVLQLAQELNKSLGLNVSHTKINVKIPVTENKQSIIFEQQSRSQLSSMQIPNKQPQINKQPQESITDNTLNDIQHRQSQSMQDKLAIIQNQIVRQNRPQQFISQDTQIINQNQINKLNESSTQIVRKSSNSCLKNSTEKDHLASPIECHSIAINSFHEPVIFQPINSFHVSQTTSYPQQKTLSMNQTRQNQKGRPPRPMSASKTYNRLMVIPQQAFEGADFFRMSNSRQHRDSSKQRTSNSSPVNIQTIIPSKNPIKIRSQSQTQNQPNSRVLEEKKMQEHPIFFSITNNKQQRKQGLIQIKPYTPIHFNDATVFKEKTDQIPQRYLLEQTPKILRQRSPAPYFSPIPSLQKRSQQKLTLKKSIQKTSPIFTNPQTSIMNTYINPGSPAAHFLHHPNRIEQPSFQPIIKQNIPLIKPVVGEVGKRISILNQRLDLNEYKY